MGNRGAKGGGFEREIARVFGLWWTGDRDDIFWRSSGSGARATTRAKVGKRTAQQYGDMCAIDAIGDPLIETITFELKRGYSTKTAQDCYDRTDNVAIVKSGFEEFIAKAHRSSLQAGSFAWLLVTRRDRRETWCYMPIRLFTALQNVGAFPRAPRPQVRFTAYIRHYAKTKTVEDPGWQTVFGCTLRHFLKAVTPQHIKQVHFKHQ